MCLSRGQWCRGRGILFHKLSLLVRWRGILFHKLSLLEESTGKVSDFSIDEHLDSSLGDSGPRTNAPACAGVSASLTASGVQPPWRWSAAAWYPELSLGVVVPRGCLLPHFIRIRWIVRKMRERKSHEGAGNNGRGVEEIDYLS